MIESQVQSYSSLASLPAPPTYRIQRTPLQQQNAQAQHWRVEAAATQALAEVGMQRDDENGVYRLELQSYFARHIPAWPHYPGWGWGGGWVWGLGYGPGGWYPSLGYYGGLRESPPTLYVFDVRLTLRDANAAVVYESSASYHDIWNDPEAIYRALMRAALDGFPTPPAGTRLVRRPATP